jgi:FMN phosphatase YigB (HAD superfamily)
MVLLLDAANTIIYKPAFYTRFAETLVTYGINIKQEDFHRIHKIISESYQFPDRTSREFYNSFNRELLYALGVIPDDKLLHDIFDNCSYLPWERFDDVKYISEIPVKKAVLSNFHGGLHEILNKLFLADFAEIIISESENLRKPDNFFLKKAVDKLGVSPSEILYVGDSVKLDLEPALKIGMNAWLIDRNDYYPSCSRRIKSLREIKNLV